MDAQKFNEYIEDRYKDQIGWYGIKASRNKLYYSVFQWSVVVLSAALPVLIATVPAKYQAVTLSISILLAVGTASLKTFKFQETWIAYRTIAETMKKERHYYDAELGDYGDSKDKDALFIERVEALISRENTLWVSTHMQQEDEEKPT